MKNRFIQMFLVICAVMLMICAVSVWAAAEDVTATPTDLAPVEQEESVPETTEPETTEPETTEPEATEPQAAEPETSDPEEAVEEEAADSVEIIITKTVRIGDSWSGTMKKTKPAVLKLDIDHAQQVNLVVLGRHGWITVEKSDRLTENPARTLTNDETSQTVISWYAEAGSYLVTLGPVEPNLMAKLNVFIMNQAAYGDWLAQQQAEEVTEEEKELPETEDTNIDETEEELLETEENTVTEIITEETEEESEEETAAENEGTEEVSEDTIGEELEAMEENEKLPEQETENEVELEENTELAEEETEVPSNRFIEISVTCDSLNPVIGDTAHFTAILNGYEGLKYTCQWQYSPDHEDWFDITGETGLSMDVVTNKENNYYYWRILLYVEDEQAE